jgi:hypothetical protein
MEQTTMRKYLAIAATAVALGFVTEANAALISCTVADPTGTPLNVRSRPYGTILGALHNDTTVILSDMAEANGQKWVKVMPVGAGKTGWVFFNYLNCS